MMYLSIGLGMFVGMNTIFLPCHLIDTRGYILEPSSSLTPFLNSLLSQLLTLLGYLILIAKKDPLAIYPLLRKYPTSIRALYDAEGYISKSVILANKDPQIIKLCSRVLQLLKIHYIIRQNRCPNIMKDPRTNKLYPTKPIIYEVYIRRCCLMRFRKYIGFEISRKNEKLDELIERRRKLGDIRHKIKWCPPT